jgi:hypothetical protein
LRTCLKKKKLKNKVGVTEVDIAIDFWLPRVHVHMHRQMNTHTHTHTEREREREREKEREREREVKKGFLKRMSPTVANIRQSNLCLFKQSELHVRAMEILVKRGSIWQQRHLDENTSLVFFAHVRLCR